MGKWCCSPRRRLAAAVLAAACAPVALANDWIASGGGSFGTAGNWSPNSVPGSGQTSDFPLAATYTVIYNVSPTTASMAVSNGGNVTFNGGLRIHTLVGDADVRSSKLAINALTLNVGDDLTVRLGGELNLSAATDIAADQFFIGAGGGAAVSSMTVSGLGSSLLSTGTESLIGGAGSAGLLRFTNSATGAFGQNLRIGANSAGSGGTLEILGGAVVTGRRFHVVGSASGASSVLISGAGSKFTYAETEFTEFASVGTGGSLSVTAGGYLVADATTIIYPNASYLVDAATAEHTAYFEVAGQGQVVNGGKLLVDGIIVAGFGETGKLTISGPGSTLTSAFGIQVGGQSVFSGTPGQAELHLLNGATASGSSLFVGRGSLSPGHGTVRVSGPGSVLTVGGEITIADSGGSPQSDSSGSLVIENGGELVADSGGAVVLGTSDLGAPTSGTITVTGLGSQADFDSPSVNQIVTVGNNALGQINVLAGGKLLTDVTILGDLAAGRGVATVSGAGSDWQNSQTLTVGDAGRGTLDIAAGGKVSANHTLLAAQSLSRGDVTLNNGSLHTQTLHVGGANLVPGGNAVVTLGFGAQLTVNEFLHLYPSGRINLYGGRLEVPDFNQIGLPSGGGTLNFVAGTLATQGSSVFPSTQLTQLFGGLSKAAHGQAIHIPGTATLQSQVVLDGGTFRANALVNGQLLQINSGTLQLDSPTLALGPSGALARTSLNLGNDTSLLAPTAAATVQLPFTLHLTGGTFRAASIFNQGDLLLDSPLATVQANTITNDNLIAGTGRVFGVVTNTASGEVRVSDGQRLLFDSSFNNLGNVNLFGGTFELEQGEILNNTNARITGRGALYAENIDNAGRMSFSAGTSDVISQVLNSGLIIVTGGSTTTFHHPVQNTAGSELRVSDSSTAVFLGDVTGDNFITGRGLKIFEAGSSSVGPLAAGGDTLVNAAAAVAADYVRESSVTVGGNLSLPRKSSGGGTSKVGSLAISPGGGFDLADNDLIVESGGLDAVADAIAAARNTSPQLWQGDGLTSTAAADDPLFGLAAVLNDDGKGTRTPLMTEFAGLPVELGDVLVAYTLNGDSDLDRKITADDYHRIDRGFLTRGAGYRNGDFDYKNGVTLDDYALIDASFLGQRLVAQGAAVPEPSAVAAPLSLCMFLRRRRCAERVTTAVLPAAPDRFLSAGTSRSGGLPTAR